MAALLLIAALTPGLWWQMPVAPLHDNQSPVVSFQRLAASTPSSWPPQLRLVNAWHLTSSNLRFGGYSALLAMGPDTLTAVNDVGTWMRVGRPRRPGNASASFGGVPRLRQCEFYRDVESVTENPATGRRWYGYELLNAIERVDPGRRAIRMVRPAAMRDWPLNGGPEAMVRLRDGRFVVLSEDPPWLSSGARPGVLFPFDPVEGAKPAEFSFRPPVGYHASDMGALPDGRVVILLRAVDAWYPPFRGMLITADPAAIRPGREWSWHKLADLDSTIPRENYEGLAIVPDNDGVTLWIISDDNFAHFQRTLLLQLHWQMSPRDAAGGVRRPPRPS